MNINPSSLWSGEEEIHRLEHIFIRYVYGTTCSCWYCRKCKIKILVGMNEVPEDKINGAFDIIHNPGLCEGE